MSMLRDMALQALATPPLAQKNAMSNSTFHHGVRASAPKTHAGRGQARQSPMHTDLHFLVVDDFATMRLILITLLKALGYSRVSEAEDGEKALALLRIQGASPAIDFVLTDWNMPVMDGITLLKTIRASAALARLPVLIVTAESKQDCIIAAARAGADGYILKPFNQATLKEKIDSIRTKRHST
jgi:two-component system chemotaxis response regulator CheY